MAIGQAERIRDHVSVTYVEPARRRGESTVRIRVGDVRKEMGLTNEQVPAICGALRTRKFREANHLALEKLEGPPKKQATTVVFTFRLMNVPLGSDQERAEAAFLAVRGIAKEAFRRLGGGEAFIRRERENFYGPGKDS